MFLPFLAETVNFFSNLSFFSGQFFFPALISPSPPYSVVTMPKICSLFLLFPVTNRTASLPQNCAHTHTQTCTCTHNHNHTDTGTRTHTHTCTRTHRQETHIYIHTSTKGGPGSRFPSGAGVERLRGAEREAWGPQPGGGGDAAGDGRPREVHAAD